MEMRYPIVLIIGLIVIIATYFFARKNKQKYTTGKRIANTQYLKNSNYFKKKILRYKIISVIVIILYALIFIFTLILTARPTESNTRTTKMKTRDIFFCLDVSTSVCDLNYQLLQEFRKTLKEIDGERIGIVIFNCTPYLLCPLTDDYDYIDMQFAHLMDGFKAIDKYFSFYSISDKEELDASYILSGTTENSERGSSLIGDALAATAFKFPKQEEDRTRIIILATDNALEGTPIVSLKQAGEICKSKNITVFGVGPGSGLLAYMTRAEEKEFRSVCESTGGTLNLLGSRTTGTMSEVFSEIEKTQAKIMEGDPITTISDIPEVYFVLLVVSVVSLVIIKEKERI